jgi:hypothetical protein
MCKANYALYVKGKMSGKQLSLTHSPNGTVALSANGVNKQGSSTQKDLDTQLAVYIIIFTYEHARRATKQTIIFARARHTESSCKSSTARELSLQRVLRSGRFAAGQVRDAAAGGYRQATDQSGSKDLWLLAPVVLSGASSLSRSWAWRAVATETRASVRAQAHARTDAVRGTCSARRADDLQFADSRTNRSALRYLGSSTQYRSSAATSKKTSVSSEPAAISLADRRLVSAYEELRGQAVQGLRRGPGLALMMARGFRGWMEACSQLFTNQSSCTQVPDRSAPCVPSGVREELVILLAGMVLRRTSKEMA